MGVATKSKLPQRSQHQSPPHALHAHPVPSDFDIPRCRVAILRSSNMAGNAPTNGGLSWTIIRKLGIVHGKTHWWRYAKETISSRDIVMWSFQKTLSATQHLLRSVVACLPGTLDPLPSQHRSKSEYQQAYEHCVCALFAETLPSETAKPWVGRILLHSKRPSLYILYILYIVIYMIYDIIYIYTIEFPVSRTNQASSPVRLSSRSLVAFALGEIVQRSP